MENKRETVCAVVVTYNRKKLLLECLESLLRQTYHLDAIYIIDNASDDGTPKTLKEKGYIKDALTPVDGPVESDGIIDVSSSRGENKTIDVRYVRMERNTGGAGGFNEGIKRAYTRKYDWMWLMDDDSNPREDALEKLTAYLERKDVVALAGSVFFPTGEIFFFTRGIINLNSIYPTIQKPISAEDYKNKEVTIDVATFVGILVKSKTVGKIGFPNKDFFIFHDDIEYCLRLGKEGKILLIPDSIIFHREHAKEGIEKSFFGKKAIRIPYERFWLTYFQRRNLVWLGKEYSTNRIKFYFETIGDILKLISGVLRFDDNKSKRIILLMNAYLDGLRGNFDNEKPKRILYS